MPWGEFHPWEQAHSQGQAIHNSSKGRNRWIEVYILYFNRRLSPASNAAFHFNFWAISALSVSPHGRFSNSSTPQGSWLDLLQYCCSFFAPGESRAGHTSPKKLSVGPLCCQDPHLPHAQLLQSMAENSLWFCMHICVHRHTHTHIYIVAILIVNKFLKIPLMLLLDWTQEFCSLLAVN